MPQYIISGIPVQFPYEAYPCQIAFMEKVIEALKGKENALLESPTGTGKTLCLLCATLAWREAYIQCRRQELTVGTSNYSINPPINKSAVSKRPLEENWEDPEMIPKIYYASRTHSQLKQVIKELRQAKYRIKMTVVGSREQLCLNPDVMKLTGTNQSRMCRQKVNRKDCSYYSSLEKLKSADEILDIEDLVNFSKEKSICPYYLSRNNLSDADIIFLPYNYLIDQANRKQLQLQLQNSIIIFDEAHNLESSCADSASIEISSLELSHCVEEVKRCLDINLQFGLTDPGPEVLKEVYDTVYGLYKDCFSLTVNSDSNERVESGSFIFDLFRRQQLNANTIEEFCEKLGKVVDCLLQDPVPMSKVHKGALAHFLKNLETLFRNEFKTNFNYTIQFFRVHIQKRSLSQISLALRPLTSFPSSSSSSTTISDLKNVLVSFWCFNAGVAMKDVMSQGVRTCILASGTLSPLDSFVEEMQLKFPHQLENPHVIDSDQLFACVVSKGPTQQTLTSSYASRSNLAVQQEMANTLTALVQEIPQGCLAFFPSYSMLQSSLEQWKPQWQLIERSKKVFVEPQSKHLFPKVMDDFERQAEEGALLIGVCRGKVSEGLDFSDSKGRAALILGIPFPNAGDAKVKLKRVYLDDQRLQLKHTLSGQEWYSQQASRAVNQAIGRVIRHRHDYGAILLLDTRFQEPQFQKQLSKWIQPHLKHFNDFSELIQELSLFFQKKANVPSSLVPMSSTSSSKFRIQSCSNSSLKRPLDSSHTIPLHSSKKKYSSTTSATSSSSSSSLSVRSFFGTSSKSSTTSLSKSILSKYSTATSTLSPDPSFPSSTSLDVISACDSSLNSTVPSSSSFSLTHLPSRQKQIQMYHGMLKLHLSSGTSSFNSILKDYKDKKITPDQLLDRIFALFTTDPIPPKPLFTGFVDFLPLTHKRTWLKKVHQFFTKGSHKPSDAQ